MKQYFALWGKDHAYTLDAYPEEIGPYSADFKHRRQLFAGPFADCTEALKTALTNCYDLRNDGKSRKKKRAAPTVVTYGREQMTAEMDALVEKVLRSR